MIKSELVSKVWWGLNTHGEQTKTGSTSIMQPIEFPLDHPCLVEAEGLSNLAPPECNQIFVL